MSDRCYTPATLTERFTEGDCHILADAVAEVSGWPVATFMSSWGGHPIIHAFNIHPSGDAVDVEGRCPMDEFRERWAPRSSVKTWATPGSLAAADRSWAGAVWDDSEGIARALAPEIVKAAS